MKKIFLIIISVTVVLVLCVASKAIDTNDTYIFDSAEETENSVDFDDFIDALPEDSVSELPKEVQDGSITGAEKLDAAYYLDKALTAVKEALLPSLGQTSGLLAILIIASVFRSFGDTLGGHSITPAFEFICSLITALVIYNSQILICNLVSQFINRICTVMNSILPVMTAIYAIGGNVTAAAVNNTGLMLAITLVENLFSLVFIPIMQICFCLSLISSVSFSIDITALSSLIKKVTGGVLVFVMTVLSFALAMQTALAESADTVGLKTVKFAVGNFVPMVGGAVSDAVGTVAESLKYIKSAGGICAIAVILLILLPTAAAVCLNRLMLSFSAAAGDMLGCKREAALLREVGSINTYMLAVIVCVSVMFIFAMTLFIRCGVAMGG